MAVAIAVGPSVAEGAVVGVGGTVGAAVGVAAAVSVGAAGPEAVGESATGLRGGGLSVEEHAASKSTAASASDSRAIIGASPNPQLRG
ncbi:MAG: hypothetical protein F4056_07195 [Chloroflexi bacterium]|nr:hypothetical protein [Chloroflexota bacterium]